MSSSPLSWRDRFYPKIWLILGISFLLVSAILWIWLQLAARVTKENSLQDTDAVPMVATLERFPASLGSLTDIVPVLDLSKVLNKPDSAHSPEFQSSAFIGAHESNWTLQLMNVSQENVITDFLTKRSDRARFQYFRYHKDEKDERFILTYGAFTTVETAMGALQTMNFGLPDSVKVFPERFSSYKPFVSDSNDVVTSDAVHMQRQVNLRPVVIPRPTDAIEVKLAQISAQSSSATVAARQSTLPADVDGFAGQPDAPPSEPVPSSNVAGAKASHDTVNPAPIQDPFN
jgi:hypothetical protein